MPSFAHLIPEVEAEYYIMAALPLLEYCAEENCMRRDPSTHVSSCPCQTKIHCFFSKIDEAFVNLPLFLQPLLIQYVAIMTVAKYHEEDKVEKYE